MKSRTTVKKGFVHSRTETEVAGEDITAKMFSVALHLPRAAEEQEKQLAILLPVPKINLLIAESHKLHKLLAASNFRGLKCHKCGSTQHLWREYPQHQPSSSTTSSTVTSVSKTAESEEN